MLVSLVVVGTGVRVVVMVTEALLSLQMGGLID